MASGARRHFARGPCRAASGDDYIAGSLRSSPARSARSAFAVQLRPAFAALPASGIYSLRPVHAACVSQRFVRRPGGGPAVMPSARGAFTALGVVPVSGPAAIAKVRLQAFVLLVLPVLPVLRQRRQRLFANRGPCRFALKVPRCTGGRAFRTTKKQAVTLSVTACF